MTIASQNGASQELIASVLEILDALDAGSVTSEDLRDRAMALPPNQSASAIAWIDLAEMLHQCPEQSELLADAVKNPRYRSGTGRKPVAWSDCLWRPDGA